MKQQSASENMDIFQFIYILKTFINTMQIILIKKCYYKKNIINDSNTISVTMGTNSLLNSDW